MRKKLINFLKSPVGRRVLLWAIPVIISFVASLLDKKDDKNDSKKRGKR